MAGHADQAIGAGGVAGGSDAVAAVVREEDTGGALPQAARRVTSSANPTPMTLVWPPHPVVIRVNLMGVGNGLPLGAGQNTAGRVDHLAR